jgi:carbamoyltransferase
LEVERAILADYDAELVVAYPWRERKQPPLADLLAQFDQADAALRQRNPELAELLGIDLETRRYAASSQWQMHELCGRALGYELARSGFGGRIAAHRRYDHHRAHAAAACFTSPFEEAVCAIVDGLGEQRSFAFFQYRHGALEELSAPGIGNGSLGLFFTRICASCGFGAFTGEEWKVMGLAPYGDADDAELYPLLKRTLRVNGLCIDRHGPNEELELLRTLRRRARKPGEPARAAANLAAVGQRVFSETLFELLPLAGRIPAQPGACGGCALTRRRTAACERRSSACTFNALRTTATRWLHARAAGTSLPRRAPFRPRTWAPPCPRNHWEICNATRASTSAATHRGRRPSCSRKDGSSAGSKGAPSSGRARSAIAPSSPTRARSTSATGSTRP